MIFHESYQATESDMTGTVRVKPIIKAARSKTEAVRPWASMRVLTDQFGIEFGDKFKIPGSSGIVTSKRLKATSAAADLD